MNYSASPVLVRSGPISIGLIGPVRSGGVIPPDQRTKTRLTNWCFCRHCSEGRVALIRPHRGHARGWHRHG